MKTQHTPGPWRVGADTKNVVRIYPQNSAQAIAGAVGDNALNDARLIAAAPDLLAACEFMLTCYSEGRVAPSEPDSYEKGLERIEQAIKKARGES